MKIKLLNYSITLRVLSRPSRRLYSSINSDEVSKFNDIGNNWWNQHSYAGSGPLHAMNPCRVSFIRNALAKHLNRTELAVNKQLSGLKVLDIGCGGGLLSESLSRLGANVIGIDPAKQSIDVATRHSSYDPLTASIEYRCATIEDISSSGEKFDVICSLEVIEHVEKPLQFLSHCTDSLNDNGSLFLSTLNRTAKSFGIAILGAEYLTRVVPTGTHDWRKFITPDELEMLVKASNKNVSLRDCKGMVPVLKRPNLFQGHIPTLLNSIDWKLSDDVEVNYIMHFIKT